MTTRTLPDTIRIIRNLLADSASVQAITPRVARDLPANPQFPFVRVVRSGGIPEWYGDDHAGVDVHCYGRTEDEAESLSRVCFKALMEASQVHAQGTLTDVKPRTDLQTFADPSYRPPQPRVIFGILATAHT